MGTISGAYAEGDEVVFSDCEVMVDMTPKSASAFVDVTSWSSEVSVSGGDVPTSRLYLFQRAGPVIFEGKRNPFRLTITNVYTEGAGDPFTNIWDKHEDPEGNYAGDGRGMDVQYSPKGGAAGSFIYTTSGGKLVDCTPPQNNAEASDPTKISYVIESGALARTASTKAVVHP